MIYLDGEPVLIDIGVGEYRKETFSDYRYDIWTMQSGFHNLPEINGVMQKDGGSFKAGSARCERSKNRDCLTLELSGAYPSEAGLLAFSRRFIFDRVTESISVRDFYMLGNENNTIRYSFICCKKPTIDGENIVFGTPSGGAVKAALSPGFVIEKTERYSVRDDHRLYPVWGDEGVHRLRAVYKTGKQAKIDMHFVRNKKMQQKGS
jgi:hypothetical protein